MDNGNNMYMPVAPAYGYGNGGFGNGMFGGDGWWVILFLFALMGNGFGGWGGFGGGYGNMMLGYDFPWLLNGQQGINANTNAGFNQAAIQSSISGLQSSVISGFGDVQLGIAGVNQNICQTGNGIVNAISNGFASAEAADNARQIANMQTAFANQTAMAQGFSGIQSQLAQCCCDNRLATCQTQNIIQNEGNQTRFADANNTRDIIDATTRGNQAILDKLCQLELDNYKSQLEAKNDLIAQLRQENLYARGQASQDIQTAELRANNATVANQLLAEMRSCPIPAQPVYGTQPIFTCNGQCSQCGCGCAVA